MRNTNTTIYVTRHVLLVKQKRKKENYLNVILVKFVSNKYIKIYIFLFNLIYNLSLYYYICFSTHLIKTYMRTYM